MICIFDIMSFMDFKIRKMENKDRDEILSMMEEFYSSNAVFTNGSREIFEEDFRNCIEENPYLKGYIFENGGKILGYSMIAKSFSTEFGKPCLWFEDLYLKVEFRGHGIIPKFIEFIKDNNKNCIFRLEAEKENVHALYVYKKLGFKPLPYSTMQIG